MIQLARLYTGYPNSKIRQRSSQNFERLEWLTIYFHPDNRNGRWNLHVWMTLASDLLERKTTSKVKKPIDSYI